MTTVGRARVESNEIHDPSVHIELQGITPEALRRDHLSVLRNPIIADVFHRTGLIEKWGRGTNRVAEMCEAAAIAPPELKEVTGGAVVTFRVPVLHVTRSQLESRVLSVLTDAPLGKAAIAHALGQRQPSGPLHASIRLLVERGDVALTLPDKPNSRLQKYRLTAAGRAALAKRKASDGAVR